MFDTEQKNINKKTINKSTNKNVYVNFSYRSCVSLSFFLKFILSHKQKRYFRLKTGFANLLRPKTQVKHRKVN